MTDSATVFGDLRVLDLSTRLAGAFCARLFGDFGAEVLLTEPPKGHPLRREPPFLAEPAEPRLSLLHAYANKRAVTLDLRDPRGVALFKQLVCVSDLVAENFTPRVMGNLGLDYASLRRLKPDIILASLSAYGADGPYANVPGIGGTIEPMSGMSSLLGYENGRPQNSGQMYPDPVAGFYFAGAMIMALHHRGRTGRGQYSDLGMMEANASVIGDALLEYAANGTVRGPLGNHHPRLAPHNIYPARDGRWLALAAQDEKAWRRLAEHVARTGGPDLLGDPRFH